MTLDLTKPVQTRDGRPARIVSENGIGALPVLALITDPQGKDHILRYTAAGNVMLAPGQSVDDLVNVPEETVTYHTVRHSPDKNGGVFFGGLENPTAEAARKLIRPDTHWGKWDGVVRITRKENRIVNLEFLDA